MESAGDLSVVMVMVDRDSETFVLARSDGKEARFPLKAPMFEPSSLLSRIAYPPTFEGLVAETCKGDSIVFELPGFGQAEQLDGRLAVYLDQNKWRLVSDVLQGQGGGGAADRAAARRLMGWLAERRIVLPLSAGHYYETTKWSDAEGRYCLGLSMLQLSGGWQLRDPLQVWRDELRLMFRERIESGGTVPPVVTLASNGVHSAVRGYVPSQPPADFSPREAFQYGALLSATTLIDLMLDSEAGERGPEAGWTAANQRFSDWLDTQDGDAQKKRKAIDAWLFRDLHKELAEESYAAGLTAVQLQEWGSVSRPVQGMSVLPAWGLYREMMHERHLNRGTKWNPNDVIDMVYLSCAAGYADFVVCERQMREPLARGINRLGRRTQVFRSLTEAVLAIEMAFDETPTS